jgi:alkanesulfonate monooxygenase SsuD/methylene tetrahydromethanopterin reductase-like flavin-dependent oxidoreductase (luciferase family)
VPLFALRYDLRSAAPDHADLPALYRAALEQCAWADRLGFASVTLSEHHGSADGYLPAPLVMAAAVAARTERMRIVIGALIAPLHDPLRLAEDLAVLSLLSGNRVIPVLAGGYVESEFRTFGKQLSARGAVMECICALLRTAWRGEPFEHEGRQACLTPRLAAAPALWMGGSTPAAARRAARTADGFIPSTPELHEVYRAERVRLGHPDPGPRPRSLGNFLHLAEDPDAAWERIAPCVLRENNAYARWAAEQGVQTPYSFCRDAAELRATARYPVLRPEELLAQMKGMGPWDTVLFHPLAGGMDPALAWDSLRLFETRVLPEWRRQQPGVNA